MDERLFWVGLNLVKGIGAVRFQMLLDHFGDARTAWEASPAALGSSGLSKKIVKNMVKVRASVDLHTIEEQLEAQQITLLTWLDEGYPRRLKDINQPPPVVYVRGEVTPQDEWAVAVVGTRRITPYGRQVTEEVAAFLARNGVTVVSGLARGIDSTAHKAALNAGGRSIAVLGSGVDRIYPDENRKLAEKMIERGALISDYPLGTPPEGTNFPPRNRLISGLCIAVVIVEAGHKSGALITADFAVNQGREVFAVPGNIFAPQSKGTNRLVRDGAHPLLSPEDLLAALDLTMVTEHQSARTVLPADATEAALFEILGHEPMHVDEIGLLAKLPIAQVSSSLALMELKGMVRQVGGMQYVAVREAQARYQTDAGM
ncbi:MAG: DNA-protecting protein DprA [Anaerolineales bacterium]|nr:MAG: DNA-protecting protein DprA [Anaerolineales bacterium]